MSESKLHLFFPDERVKKGLKWEYAKMNIPKKEKVVKDEEVDYSYQKQKFSYLLEILDKDFSTRFSDVRLKNKEYMRIDPHVYVEITFLAKVKEGTEIFNIYNLSTAEDDEFLNKWIFSFGIDDYKKFRQDLETYAKTPGTEKPNGYQKVLSIISSFRLIVDDDRFDDRFDYLAENNVEILLYNNVDKKEVETALKSCTSSSYSINGNKILISSEDLLPHELKEFAELTDGVKKIVSQHYSFSITPEGEVQRLKPEFEIGLLKSSTTVCIVDSGIQDNDIFKHLLERNPHFNYSLINKEYFEDMVKDGYGHGTSVASIVVFGDQISQNKKGEPLIPYARVCSLQMWTDTKPSISVGFRDIVKHMENIYDASNGQIKIFNLSIGSETLKDNVKVSDFAFLIDKLAHKKGIIPVISAGNLKSDFIKANKHPQYWMLGDTNILAPADAINGITVGSLKNNDYIAEYSTKDNFDTSHLSKSRQKHRRKPDLVTFGGDLGKNLFKCLDSEGYLASKSGTSYAAPYITHLLVLLTSAYPDLGTDALKGVLLNNAICIDGDVADFYRNNLGHDNFIKRLYGFGKVTSENVESIISSNNDEATIIVEAQMDFSKYTSGSFPLMTTKIIMPEFLKKSRSKSIWIDATLTYRPNVLKTIKLNAYNPCYLAFKIHSGQDEINSTLTNLKGEPWSQVPSLLNAWSNVQKIGTKLSRKMLKKIAAEGLQITVKGRLKKDKEAIEYYRKNPQNFAIVISIRDKEKEGILYEELKAKNNLTIHGKSKVKVQV
ncbi:S8 family peptidase [Candidatus Peregrinibacteria bacterium]|nr:S8 family peptidase [Candidatus Peregrinibacteria bacterium]